MATSHEQRLDFLAVAGENRDLPHGRVEHGVAHEELLAHLLFHVLADGVQLLVHQAVGRDGREIWAVHHRRDVVCGDGAPVGDPGGGHLVAAAVPAVRIAKHMPDQDRQVRIKDFAVHDHRVAQLVISQVDQVLPVFEVVVDDLVGRGKLVVNLRRPACRRISSGVFFRCSPLEQISVMSSFQRRPSGILRSGSGWRSCGGAILKSALDLVREADGHFCSWTDQLADGRHAHGIQDRLAGGRFDVFGRKGGSGTRLAGNKNSAVSRQFDIHQSPARIRAVTFS